MKMRFLLSISLAAGLVLCLSSLAGAAPAAGKYFFGIECGEASLNNDPYVYSSEAATRQPELAPQQSSRQDGPAYSIYVGRTLAAVDSRFLGSSALTLGFQGGYTDLGTYTTTIEYGVSDTPAYRKLTESTTDLLLTSSLFWENGFNLFAKAGVARLQGEYEQEGLLSPRNPAYVPERESYTYVFYRPEIVLGLGYSVSERVELHVQYKSVLGPKPNTSLDRFNESSMVELPNTLYAADALTVGATFRW